eukprot:TRINITY_DN205_c0_g2_i1.p1 TRINITY_DN205_c0_g2~~TRINITY_DN205_c0_g2_i1.p1  ORF type:complete len:506 (-),score=142.72 TRINITY_DN205_c0_g2_i1:22-1539(-)
MALQLAKSCRFLCLLAFVAAASAATAPSGVYKGSTKEFGVTVDATITIDDTSHADIVVAASGLTTVNIDCKKEAYTIDSSGAITLAGASTTGDCVHDSLQKYTVDLNSVTYDSGSDSIALSVHKILNIKVTLSKNGLTMEEIPAPVVVAAPSGVYKGSTKEFGVTVDATITIDDTSHADIVVAASGLTTVNIDCKKEAYTIDSSGAITLAGASTTGDCVHDSLQKYTVDLNSVTYDSGSDSIALSVHKILNIKVTLSKNGLTMEEIPAPVVVAAPSGTYHGTTKEVGVTVDATITIDDTSHADIAVTASGLVTVDINCKKEGYTLDSTGKVTLPGQSTAGDCIHDGLQKYTVDLNSVTYDAASDSIVLMVHKILNIKVTLSKGGLSVVVAPSPVVLAAPSGTYTGTTKELGVSVKATITIDDSSHADIVVAASGLATVNIDCKTEAYTIDSSGAIALPGQSTAGDCIHDSLAKYTVDLNSVTYDASSDSIALSVHKFLNIKVSLS